MNCHEAELERGDDSHPKSKFTDPRNADRVARLDARKCVTCHVEHKPEITGVMGVTVPEDVCFHCHQGIGEERSSHRGMAFSTCASAGCHNFHDNRALYEDFLVKHAGEPRMLETPRVEKRDYARLVGEIHRHLNGPLAEDQSDAPVGVTPTPRIGRAWAASAHARGGVNCTDCHTEGSGKTGVWTERPGYQACQSCHARETDGFLEGKHGMRLATGLPPMSPASARLPMKDDARERHLGCTSCHGAHEFDTRRAAVEGCLGCHDDEHSNAYRRSPHFRQWEQELAGSAAPGTGVSCATCHLPRERHRVDGIVRTVVQHNQNMNLRPNEKMLRGVCMNCHGLGFAIDALADSALIRRNFSGRPSVHIPSIDMAEARDGEGEKQKGEGVGAGGEPPPARAH